MKAQRRAANGFLPAAVLACALFADLGHAGQWSRPGLRASLSGSSGGACSAGLPDGRSFITGGRDRAGPLASTAYFETDGRTTPAAPMLGPRADHVCVALDDGTAYGPKTRIGGPKGAEPGALISLDPDQALQALRPMPRYGSHLGSIMHEHIQRMRTLGCRYGHENVFLRFDRFLQQRPDADHESVDTLIHEYVADARSVNARLRRLILGRIIARALNRQGTSVAVPPIDPLLLRQNRNQQLQPYIYTEEEVERLLATASGFPSPRAPLRPLTLYTMLTLAYCAGLRLGEIVRLKLRDVDLPDGSIEICDTKFFKSRRLPLSTTAITDLSDYLKTRRRAGAPLDPESSVFWHNRGWYRYSTAGHLLYRVIRRAGILTKSGKPPRVHDLRGTFAVHRLTSWYQDGIQPESRLPYLAAYLGHRDINSTLVYLTMTDELLERANQRFRTAELEVLKAVRGET